MSGGPKAERPTRTLFTLQHDSYKMQLALHCECKGPIFYGKESQWTAFQIA